MDLLQVVGVIALVAGVAALALVLELRGRMSRLELSLAAAQKFSSDLQSAHEAVHDELADLRSELLTTQRHLDRAQRELGELKAAAEVLPAPPLPRARSGSGVDDLREQLRAAHREPDSTDEA